MTERPPAPPIAITRATSRPEMDVAIEIRQRVFGDEQQIVLPRYDDDEDWVGGVTVIAWIGETAVGTGRLVPSQISRQGVADIAWVATLPEHRGLGVATRIMIELRDIADGLGEERVYLSAQTYALELYRRLGFHPFSSTYVTHGIPHQPMVRRRPHAEPPLADGSGG